MKQPALHVHPGAPGTAEVLAEVKAGLMNGTINVFDTNTFTVDGVKIPADHKADVDTDEAYTADTDVVNDNGVFEESKFRSAHYFDLKINGITLVNTAF